MIKYKLELHLGNVIVCFGHPVEQPLKCLPPVCPQVCVCEREREREREREGGRERERERRKRECTTKVEERPESEKERVSED